MTDRTVTRLDKSFPVSLDGRSITALDELLASFSTPMLVIDRAALRHTIETMAAWTASRTPSPHSTSGGSCRASRMGGSSRPWRRSSDRPSAVPDLVEVAVHGHARDAETAGDPLRGTLDMEGTATIEETQRLDPIVFAHR